MLLLLTTFLSTFASAEDRWLLLPEPKFMGHKITITIEGAKNTVFAAARLDEFGPSFATEDDWKKDGVVDATLLANARAAGAEWLKQLKPELVRGPDKVVNYARLASDKIPVAATVLAPEFTRQFEAIFGPKFLVAIPNRHTVFIFPALAGKHQQYAGTVLAAWRSHAPRVSLEVFEVTGKGLRAVGVFAE
jgi:hypothetical protein